MRNLTESTAAEQAAKAFATLDEMGVQVGRIGRVVLTNRMLAHLAEFSVAIRRRRRMNRAAANAELCRVRDIALKQAAECRASSGALYRLVAHFADSTLR